MQHAMVRYTWGTVLVGIVGLFGWAHYRAKRALNRPFALFLHRFSTFADRSLIVDVIKSVPRDVPVVLIASRDDHAGNWDPFIWAFAGLQLTRPLRIASKAVGESLRRWLAWAAQV
jgi:hypothetical protein